MKKICAILLMVICVSCGGDDNDVGPDGSVNCGFEFAAITNGPNGDSISSYWQCATSGPLAAFALTDNGEGAIIATNGQVVVAGNFEWDEIGCGRAAFTDEDGTVQGQNLEGSRADGTLTFTLVDGDDRAEFACALVTK